MIGSLQGHLAIPVAQAQAMYRALAAPGVYQELVEESGWSPEDFERWVAETLRRDVLEGTRPPRPKLILLRAGRPPEPHRLCVCDLGRKVGVKASATPASGLAAHACAVVLPRSRRSQLPEGHDV